MKIRVKTSGYGGKTLNKKILVKTDDPENQKFNLIIRGKVASIVRISPKTVSLKGIPGEVLETVVSIEPRDKYRFSILEINQRVGEKIKAELVAPKKGESVWQVRVVARSEIAEDLYDVITLKTDSQYKSKITIRVYATYLENENSKS